MTTTIAPTISITNWDEAPYDELDGTKLTKARVTKQYAGDLVGESVTESLMAYAPDGTADFVGIERITGTIDGRKGTFVLQHVGRFEDGAARAACTVVASSGTGDLVAASGGGDFLADPNPSITLSLDLG
jgi:hypothetical protein